MRLGGRMSQHISVILIFKLTHFCKELLEYWRNARIFLISSTFKINLPQFWIADSSRHRTFDRKTIWSWIRPVAMFRASGLHFVSWIESSITRIGNGIVVFIRFPSLWLKWKRLISTTWWWNTFKCHHNILILRWNSIMKFNSDVRVAQPFNMRHNGKWRLSRWHDSTWHLRGGFIKPETSHNSKTNHKFNLI